MTVVFIVLVLLIIGGTAAALAGRWQPEGLPDGRPEEPVAPDAESRFDVVLRGYRMDQVDRELARLREQLRVLHGADERPGGGIGEQARVEDPSAAPDGNGARGTDQESFGR